MDRGERREEWIVPEALRRRMTEVAREFRKTPTASEAILWEALRGKRTVGVKFRRQQPMGPFVVDFYAPAVKLVVEVDGSIHEKQPEIDRERQRLIESLGVRFVRIARELIENDLALALNQIRDALGPLPLSPAPPFPHQGGKGDHDGRKTSRRRPIPVSRRETSRSSPFFPFPPWWGKGAGG